MAAGKKIVAGPSKFDLMLSLFEKGKTISVTTDDGVQMQLSIMGITLEDGSYESWCLKGYVCGANPGKTQYFWAYFRTDNRTGYFEFRDKLTD